jgi:sec-independent protein translocase protein TatA
MPNIGPMELIVVLAIALLIVGPKKLPGLGRSLGTSIREFKDTVTKSDPRPAIADDDDADPDTRRPAAG